VLGVASFTAVAVHHLDQREIKRVEGERAAEIKRVEGERAAEIKRVEGERAAEMKLAAAEIKRVEGERRLSEERLRAEVERYKYDLQLRHTQDYKPYQAAKEQANKERGGTGGPQKEEETD
jgi:regulator of protease activity HflC (stomatin/prohibitin superfamily)